MLDSIQSGLVIDGDKASTVPELRKVLTQAYGESGRSGPVGSMDDAELLEVASDLRTGVPVATPVFDGAHEQGISNLLELAGLSRSGQEILIDGRWTRSFCGSSAVPNKETFDQGGHIWPP